MTGSLKLLLRQLDTLWKHFGINQKVSIILALVATLAAIGAIVYTSGRPDFRLLYTGMTLEDAARAQETLEEQRIPVQLRNHGQAIYVPAGDVYRARLLLASSGLPGDTSAGFELFEEPKFGLTEFAQQVNYQRALQGELERTIASIEGVQAARVMLVMPRDRLFATEEDRTGSASIMLTLRRGSMLDPNQVVSITQLVSSSVPGVSENQVTITDQQGRLLSDPHHSEDIAMGSPRRQMDLQRQVERELTQKAQDMLDLAIGAGQAIVRVNAEMDFRQVERFNETFDSENRVVVRETISSENSSEPITLAGAGMARVAVGTPADIMIEQAMGELRREDIDTEYRVPSGRETVIDRGGRIGRLSVSVSVARGETPRDEEALQQIERMVRSAVGYSPQRQDSIEVLEMAFANLPPPSTGVPGLPWWQSVPFLTGNALRTLTGLALLLTLYIISRKALRQLSVQREEVGTPVSELAAGDQHKPQQLPEADPFIDEEEGFDEIEYVTRLAEQDPGAVATWIDQAMRSAAPTK
jgi:flagellar M-ring protein FliF